MLFESSKPYKLVAKNLKDGSGEYEGRQFRKAFFSDESGVIELSVNNSDIYNTIKVDESYKIVLDVTSKFYFLKDVVPISGKK